MTPNVAEFFNNVVINQSYVPEFEGQIPLAVKTEQLAVTSHTIANAFIMITCCNMTTYKIINTLMIIEIPF